MSLADRLTVYWRYRWRPYFACIPYRVAMSLLVLVGALTRRLVCGKKQRWIHGIDIAHTKHYL